MLVVVVRGRPVVQYLHRLVCVTRVARDIPADGVQIRCMSVLICILATAAHVRGCVVRIAILRQWVCDQKVPVVDPWMSPCGYLSFHAVEVGLGMEAAGMNILCSCQLICW